MDDLQFLINESKNVSLKKIQKNIKDSLISSKFLYNKIGGFYNNKKRVNKNLTKIVNKKTNKKTKKNITKSNKTKTFKNKKTKLYKRKYRHNK